jgi:hypothetical protein
MASTTINRPADTHLRARFATRARSSAYDQALDRTQINTVAYDVEDSKLAGRPVDLRSDVVAELSAGLKWSETNDGQTGWIDEGNH